MDKISILELDVKDYSVEESVFDCIDLYNESIEEDFSKHIHAELKDWNEVLENDGVDWSCWKVLLKEELIIGFYLLVGNNKTKKGLLQLFAIDKNYQGQGLGKILLEDCLDQMDRYGCEHKIAFAKREMKKTIGFYQKVWGRVDFNKNMLDEYGDPIVEISFNRRPKQTTKLKM